MRKKRRWKIEEKEEECEDEEEEEEWEKADGDRCLHSYNCPRNSPGLPVRASRVGSHTSLSRPLELCPTDSTFPTFVHKTTRARGGGGKSRQRVAYIVQ